MALARAVRRTPPASAPPPARVPAVVWAATAAFGLLLCLYSVVVPLNEAPDEPSHVDLVFHLAAGGAYPDFDGRHLGAAATRLCQATAATAERCPAPGEDVRASRFRLRRAADAPPRSERPSFEELGGTTEAAYRNEIAQHPPLYYLLMSGVVRLERVLVAGQWPFDREVALVRLANAGLVMWLPLLAWFTARRAGLPDAVGCVAALAPLAVPQLLHIGSTVNNDNLLVVLGAALAALLAGVARGDRSRRTAALVGLVIGLALFTKAFALVFLPAIAAAHAVGRRAAAVGATSRRRARAALVVAAAGALAAAGWWFLANLVRHGSLAPSLADERLSPAVRPEGFVADPVEYLSTFTRLLSQRFWGSFGWHNLELTFALAAAATLAGLGLATLGVAAAVRTPARPGERRVRAAEMAVLLLPAVLLAALVLHRAWSLHLSSGQVPFVQGRYLFGGIAGLAVAAAVGMWRLAGRWSAAAALVAGAVLQLDALRHMVGSYWGAPGAGPGPRVRAMMAWSPWPVWLQAAGALLLAGSVAWLLVEVRRGAAAAPLRRALRWSTVAGVAAAVAASVFVARALAGGWDRASDALASASRPWLVAAFLLAALAVTWMAWCWRHVLRLLGADVGARDAVAWYMVGEAAKYVPGGVWPLLGRAEMARRGGLPRSYAYPSVVLSLLLLYLAGALVAAALLPFTIGGGGAVGPWLLSLLALPAGILALHPRALRRALSTVRRLSGWEIPVEVPSWGASACVVMRYTPAWLLVGASTWAVARALTPAVPATRLVFAATVSWVAGFLVVPVPAGAGVREAVLVATAGLPAGLAAVVAVASRVLFVLVDVLGALVGGALSQGGRPTPLAGQARHDVGVREHRIRLRR